MEGLRRAFGASQINDDKQDAGIELSKYDFVARKWCMVTPSCKLEFYDAHEDREGLPCSWSFEISSAGIDEPLSEAMDMQLQDTQCRATFCTRDGVWAVKLPTSERYNLFKQVYFNKLFENMYQCENTKANQQTVFGKDLAGRMFTNDPAPEDWGVSDDESEQPTKSKRVAEQQSMDRTATTISSIEMGMGKNSYICRGSELDVLINARGCVQSNNLTFSISRASGDKLVPNKMLLGQHETKMNILTADEAITLFHADVETGKVVTEWKFEKNGVDVPMLDIAGKFKGAQNVEDPTLLSLDSNRLCRWDMRAPKGAVADMASSAVLEYVTGKDYSRGTNFSCIASAGDGSVAVGSTDGKIRLYNDNQKLTRANTSLPPLGAKITALDITYDGRWILATTDKFIQISKTDCKDADGKTVSGFKKSLAGRQAPSKLLRLKPEDQALVCRSPFKNAKFTFITAADRQERWIVASCGKYTILWNFRVVKLSHGNVKSHGGLTTVTEYQMIEKNENVVDSSFMHDNYVSRSDGDTLVVATDYHVYSTMDE